MLSGKTAGLVSALSLLMNNIRSSNGFTFSPAKNRLNRIVHASSDALFTGKRGPNYMFMSSNVDNDKTNRYIPPESKEHKVSVREPPYPKVGDIVRYYDLDGGSEKGQILVGKIVLIQPIGINSNGRDNSSDDKDTWLTEIVELDNVGDSYYAEYPSRERKRRKSLRKLEEVAPILASYVRSEDAFKVPINRNTQDPLTSFESYKLDGYKGPQAVPIDKAVLLVDEEKYVDLKGTLLKDASIVGTVGAIVAQLFKGTEDALIYAAGAAAGVCYLYFLSIKTDTLGTANAKFGKNISNFRFVLPVMVLAVVAVCNQNAEPTSYFSTVTPEQFASAMIGFLTYRIPLFLRQLQPLVSESALDIIPGSAGLALKVAQQNAEDTINKSESNADRLLPILVISGPPGTGKTTLVNALVEQSNGKFIRPSYYDRMVNGAKFELIESRGEFLEIDNTNRYGLTSGSLLSTRDDGSVLVIDASVSLAKKLTKVGGVRLIGIWVGLDSLDKFEARIRAQMDEGALKISKDESRESIIRAKIRETVQDIEYGVVSGIFEFTILNDDLQESIRQVQTAAQYCFK